VIDGNPRILELTVGIEMTYAQLGNLAGRSGYRCLMTLAAGLGVVDGAEPIRGDVFQFLKEFLVGLAASVVGESVAQVVEACRGVSGRGGRLCGEWTCRASRTLPAITRNGNLGFIGRYLPGQKVLRATRS
jgi:hypothetical protein